MKFALFHLNAGHSYFFCTCLYLYYSNGDWKMLPETIPHYSIGPFFGFTANTVVLILCLVTFLIYSSYRPLLRLLFFYLFLSLFFLGWFIQGLQIPTESIVWGYRINLFALTLLPATWVFFMLALSDKKPGLIPWLVTMICIILSVSAPLGEDLDLMKIKIQGKQFGFDVSADSKRCIYLAKNEDICPGRISLCYHCNITEDCLASGRSIFRVSFPLASDS